MFLIALAISTHALAGGFQLNLQGIRSIGLGGAYTGLAIGPSSVYYNPGALTQLKSHSFNLGVNYVMPSVSLQTAVNDNINQTSPNATPFHAYYGGKITDKIFVGFGINNQFGSSSSFDSEWEGKYIVQNISLRTFMFQPTVAYKIHDKVSVGAGFVYTAGSFSTEKAVPVTSQDNLYGEAHLEGKGNGFGYNIGVHSELLKADSSRKFSLSLGVDYRSQMSVNIEDGIANFTNIPSYLATTFPASTKFSGGLTLPSVFTAGFSLGYTINPDINLNFVYDFNYTGWSSYDTLAFDFENPDTPDSKTVKNWKNSPTQRFGLEMEYKKMLYVRVGGYYDVTPIPDGYVSPELPDATQFVPTAGLGLKLQDKLELDLSWLHQYAEREGSLDDAGFSAKYRRAATVISFGITYNL